MPLLRLAQTPFQPQNTDDMNAEYGQKAPPVSMHLSNSGALMSLEWETNKVAWKHWWEGCVCLGVGFKYKQSFTKIADSTFKWPSGDRVLIRCSVLPWLSSNAVMNQDYFYRTKNVTQAHRRICKITRTSSGENQKSQWKCLSSDFSHTHASYLTRTECSLYFTIQDRWEGPRKSIMNLYEAPSCS